MPVLRMTRVGASTGFATDGQVTMPTRLRRLPSRSAWSLGSPLTQPFFDALYGSDRQHAGDGGRLDPGTRSFDNFDPERARVHPSQRCPPAPVAASPGQRIGVEAPAVARRHHCSRSDPKAPRPPLGRAIWQRRAPRCWPPLLSLSTLPGRCRRFRSLTRWPIRRRIPSPPHPSETHRRPNLPCRSSRTAACDSRSSPAGWQDTA